MKNMLRESRALLLAGTILCLFGWFAGVVGLMPGMSASGMGGGGGWDRLEPFRVAGTLLLAIAFLLGCAATGVAWTVQTPALRSWGRVLITLGSGFVLLISGGMLLFLAAVQFGL